MSARPRSVAGRLAAVGVLCGVAAWAWLKLAPAAAPGQAGLAGRPALTAQPPPDRSIFLPTSPDGLPESRAASRPGDLLPSAAAPPAYRVVSSVSTARPLPEQPDHPSDPVPGQAIPGRSEATPAGPDVMVPAGGTPAAAPATALSPPADGDGPAVAAPPAASPAVSVPPGERLPALFYDERPLPPPQRRALDRLANEFIDAVEAGGSTASPGAWSAARAKADRQYITLYGHAAYNALHLQAAKEAAREARAAAQAR